MYAISPDGQELAYTSNIDEVEAISTNSEIFIVSLASSSANGQSGSDPKKISASPGADSTPLYSPDGKYLAWRSQARAGFEADKWRLFVQDRQSGKTRDLTEKFDRSVGSYSWNSTSEFIYFSYESAGQAVLGQASVGRGGLLDPNLLNSSAPTKAELEWPDVHDEHIDNVVVTRDALYYTQNLIAEPDEIWSENLHPDSHGDLRVPRKITHVNEGLLANIDKQGIDDFTFKGANDEKIHGFIVTPPGFDPNRKYPLKFLIHGGPQGAWGNSWTYRWNAELFAANGYVVVMINFHGSTGYGQKFTDSISGDWGGKPYIDLMKGLDYVEKTFPFIDKNREAALGASYGGYMANWLLGHTDHFKCIVSHDGVFNCESAYGTTEELWFNEWEFGGPPWKNREKYRRYSPHLFADKFKTPTLVIHGQNDYRLDVSEGFQLFTTLQRLKIPSKMLYFPDEGHWVLKPQNSRLWYKTVNDWVDQWCSPSRTGR